MPRQKPPPPQAHGLPWRGSLLYPRRGTFPIPVVGGFRKAIEVTSTSVTLGSKFRLCCSRAPTRRSNKGLIGCGCSQPLLALSDESLRHSDSVANGAYR